MKHEEHPKEKGIAFLMFVIVSCLSFLTGCNHNGLTESSAGETLAKEGRLFMKEASKMDDDTGWYFCFKMQGHKDDPSYKVYTFIGMNLRYRYKGNYWDVSYRKEINPDNTITYYRTKTLMGVMRFGKGSDAEKNDRKVLNSFLKTGLNPEELLALNPNDYSFEVLDKDLFFSLMHTALEGENSPESIYVKDVNRPGTAMLVEQYYLDGYRFQIAFAMNYTVVDEIYIDVLYQTGEAYNDYKQLSDMVENGEANADQKEAFALIQNIRKAIKEENSFLAVSDLYQDKAVGNIDFSRLYRFLVSVDNNNFSGYTSLDDVPWITDELTEEEALADMEKNGLTPIVSP